MSPTSEKSRPGALTIPKSLRTWLKCEQLEDRVTPSAYQPPTFTFVHQYDAIPTQQPPLAAAVEYLAGHNGEFGINTSDLANIRVTDLYRDADTGLTHIYLRQMVNGLEIENANINLTVADDGRVLTAAGGFVADLAGHVPSGPVAPTLTAAQAVQRAALALGVNLSGGPVIVHDRSGFEAQTVISAPELSLDDITARLHYVPTADGGVALSWQMVIRTTDMDHWYDLSIADGTGEMISQSDWVSHAVYRVLEAPDESFQDGGFTLITDPHDTTASPFGWHDTNGAAGAEFTDTRGNNVDAHLDVNNDNMADGARPDGGAALDFSAFNFNPLAAAGTPGNQAMAQINLFYSINYIHDVVYQYGFTELAGNFQVNNYGRGGLGADAVEADSQDGSSLPIPLTNNANFFTPPDGTAPRMQQYIFTITNPTRDSSLDNNIIWHEYGHGISNRLTGGPANASALQALQSSGMGEGWSDFYAMMLLQRPSDTQNAGYGLGTYVLGQPQTGPGVRSFPYSFNMAIDPLTFDGFGNFGTTSYGAARTTQSHATGTIWNSALWDLNWMLINKYGYDSDLGTGWTAGPGPAGAGNKLTMHLVTEAMKLQPALPNFLQARDAILAADMLFNGGADQDEIWIAFARRGLGIFASTPGSNSPILNIDFNVPNSLSISPASTVDEGDTGTTAVTFTVSLEKPSTQTVSVRYSTANGTATSADGDFTAASGTLTFLPGQQNRTITVFVKGDFKFEADETFFVNLATPANAFIEPGAGQGVATILDDDTAPTISLGDVVVAEGDNGTRSLNFTVTLSTASGLAVSVNFATANGTATVADGDFAAASGPLLFSAGTTTRTVSIQINGDRKFELDETLGLILSGATGASILDADATGTILNDDQSPRISVASRTVDEGHLGISPLAFTVVLEAVAGTAVTVDYDTLGLSAAAGVDFVPLSGTLSFAPGQTSQTVTVHVIGEELYELDEAMLFHATGANNESVAVGTIANDDPLPMRTAVGTAAGAPARVVVLDGKGITLFVLAPFGDFLGGVSVGTGDVNGDYTPDIIVGAGAGAGPHVRIYDGVTGLALASFLAFGAEFGGGVNVSAGDLDGDGRADIIVGAGPGAGPHVKIFDGATLAETMSFFAYDSGFKGGVTVAVGDLDGDGRVEFVTGTGDGGDGLVKAFRGGDAAELYRFLAYGTGYKGGVSIATGDLNGDGVAEIITGAGPGGGPHVKVFRGSDARQLASFYAYDRNFLGGLTVAAHDIDGDGIAELLTGAGSGAPHVKAFRGLQGLEVFGLVTDEISGGIRVG